ncbi:MAG: hypothetical protein KAI66_21555 [Lentisphaeria bacterium]|nr:hypothetical protein [Lentisphaeria bacterium]
MSIRSVLIGLFAAFFIAGLGFVNDRILELESFNNGHQLPIIVLGVLFIVVVAINPLLVRYRQRWAFRPPELAVIVVLAMVSCSIPGRGLMEQFTQVLVMPYHWSRVTPGWQQQELLDYAPEGALVTVTEENYDDTVSAYIMGVPKTGRDTIPRPLPERMRRKWNQVPWGAWMAPLATWLPMIFLVAISSVCLSLIVHKQWSKHEFLSYPIADFTTSLLQREPKRLLPQVFSNRGFWIGFLLIFSIRVNNGMCVWFPDFLIPVNLTWRITPFAQLFPDLFRVQWGGSLLRLNLFPLVVAFAFFLSSEISLTLGISQILWVIFALPMVKVGVNLSTDWIGGWQGWQRAGSYLAFSGILLYTGRNYYWELLRGAVAPWRESKAEATGVWACRVLIVVQVALIYLLWRLGLELPFAILVVLLMMLAFVIVSRISAETGLFFIQPRWMPFGVLLAAFGSYAMPPRMIVIAGLACMVLCVDQSQAIMPYLVNGLKIGDNVKLKPVKLAGLSLGMYGVGVILAIVIVLVATYDFGTPTGYGWSYKRLPIMSFRAAQPAVMQLEGQGIMEKASSEPWQRRFSRIMPTENFLWAFGFGVVAVLVFSFLRLRVRWWPLHPVMFLLWATYPMATTCFSFFAGWVVKKATVRFAGQHMVKKMKPFMIGIIAGEILGALVFMAVGAIYYFSTGEKPLSYRFFPR